MLKNGLGVESGFYFMQGYVFKPGGNEGFDLNEIYEQKTYSNKVINSHCPVRFFLGKYINQYDKRCYLALRRDSSYCYIMAGLVVSKGKWKITNNIVYFHDESLNRISVMKAFFLLLFVVASKIGFSQSKCDCFDRLHNLSNVYLFSNDWPRAVSILKDGLSYLPPDIAGNYYYELASDYTHFDTDSAITYFTKAITQGYPEEWIKTSYPAIYLKMDSVEIKKYTAENRAKIDFALYNNFVSVLERDQFIRNEDYFPRRYLFDSALTIKKVIDTLYNKVDSSTFEFVKEVLEKYQYPTENKLQFYPSGFMVFLLHLTSVDDERSKYIIKKLDELNETCDLPRKSIILALIDRQKLYATGKSCCGVAGYNRYASIADLTKVDSIRFSYNQIRLAEELSGSDSTSVKSLRELKSRGYKKRPYPKNYFCNEKYHFN
jgi:hypothetical protein